MERVEQTTADITGSLSTLEAPWQDEHAAKVITLIQEIQVAPTFGPNDIGTLFDKGFDAAFTACQLFLGVSKDEFQDRLGAILGPRKIGAKSFKADRAAYLEALEKLGLPTAMAAAVNLRPVWSDILIERLR